MPRAIVLATTTLVLAIGALGITRVIAVPVSPGVLKQEARDSRLIEQVRRGGGGRVSHGGGHAARGARVSHGRSVSRHGSVARHANVRARHADVRRTNIRRVDRRTNVVNRRVVRPVRPWVRRPWYGRVVAGVALGSVIWATTAGTAPAAPASNLCWYWSNSSQTRGYWDYCVPPA